MTTHRQSVLLTYDDYRELPEDRNRYELLEGELVVTPTPSLVHQHVVVQLAALLVAHSNAHDLGLVCTAPCDVLLSDVTVVQPDLLFVSRQREEIAETTCVRGAPDLVVEVLSPATARRDLTVKRKLYSRHGVPCYWLIDPDRREIIAYDLANNAARPIVTARGEAVFSAPPFADLAIPLARLWWQPRPPRGESAR